ncbi:MAG TPA: 4-carboxymuconolactone decarboxylase [Candidatus Elarobacter sp.]|nr:4-carboxymuconolactone decarboxylase [Candidatus Elarobacter sp.]HEV2740578.1 4-carboxymuconolactone decarboxylase [Candidatus Elarobacter sp.]
MSDEKLERGMAVRRAVLGEEHVDRAQAGTTEFTRDFQELITRYAWGELWTRPGVDRKTRSLLTIAILAALGRSDELRLHVRATRNTGATRDEVKEVLLQVAVYAGVPAANSAFAHAAAVYRELDEEAAP